MSRARREAHQAQGVLRALGPSDPAPCNSCGHTAPAGEFIPELTPSWVRTGNHVCRDADECYKRRRDRELPARSRKR